MVYPVSFLPAQRFNSKVTFSGYSSEHKVQTAINQANKTKNPYILLNLLDLPKDKNPLYTKDLNNDYKQTPLYQATENSLIKLIESKSIPENIMNDIGFNLQWDTYQNYEPSDQVFNAIQKRLYGI